MCAVCVEEAAAVGAKHLDGFLGSYRTLRDRLRKYRGGLAVGAGDGLALHELGRVVRLEVLDNALRHQREREDERDRKKHPQRTACKVHPEVAKRLHLATRNAADESNCKCKTDGSGPEVMCRQAEHLREIAHRA